MTTITGVVGMSGMAVAADTTRYPSGTTIAPLDYAVLDSVVQNAKRHILTFFNLSFLFHTC